MVRDSNFYDISNSEAIIKVAGYYLISLRGYFTNNIAFSIGISLSNGDVICNGIAQKLLGWGYSESCAICNLNEGDVLQTFISTTDSAVKYCNVSNRSTLNILKI